MTCPPQTTLLSPPEFDRLQVIALKAYQTTPYALLDRSERVWSRRCAQRASINILRLMGWWDDRWA